MRISRRSYLQEITAETVVVQTTVGDSVRGVLTGVYADCLVLTHAAYLIPEGAPMPIDGEFVIERPKVHFLQRLPGAET